jgi:HlyD family secretion protein
MSKRIFAVIAVVVVAGATTVWWNNTNHKADRNSNTLLLHGNVDIRQVNLAFNASERVVSMSAEEGQKVHAGDVLAELDSRRLKHTVDQLNAQVEAQTQVVAQLEAGSRPQEISKARAQVEAAKATLENARRTVTRTERLIRQNLASEEQLDNARTATDTAEAQLQVTQQELALAEAGPRKEEIAAAKATLRAYQAQLALARLQLEDTQLVAPSDGVIENRLLEPGDMASPQSPVYTLALSDPLWIRAYVDEPNLGKLHPGMRVEVLTDSYPDQPYEGWIGFISPTAEFTPKSVETLEVRTDLVYQVRVFVCNPEDQLRLGMPASVRIPLNQQTDEGRPVDASLCKNRKG